MSKLLGARDRFGKGVLFSVLLGMCTVGTLQADEDTWLKRSREILEKAPGSLPPPWLRTEPTSEALEAAQGIAQLNETGGSRGRTVLETPGRVLIFASLSIPVPTLRALLEEASAPDAVLILRGVPRGSNIQQAMAQLRALLPPSSRVPNVILDPTAFHRFNVTLVPTLALMERGRDQPVVAVGAVTVQWLRRMASTVAKGSENLGRRAEVYEISEPDFVLEMQQRLAAIDWAAQREAAMGRFWSTHQDFVRLPDAPSRREYLVDPSVEVTQDLEDAQGNVLVHAGQRWNPLDWVVLSKTLIVFRGTDPRQVRAAASTARRVREKGRGVILLTTTIDTSRGWQHLDELEQALSGPVYVLPNSLAERFHLVAVPATIVSRGKRLLVTEGPLGDEP
ncbi:MAG: TrbC family F-type conjugative pilus assembly protein [Steroidobacteraceae bacterium]